METNSSNDILLNPANMLYLFSFYDTSLRWKKAVIYFLIRYAVP